MISLPRSMGDLKLIWQESSIMEDCVMICLENPNSCTIINALDHNSSLISSNTTTQMFIEYFLKSLTIYFLINETARNSSGTKIKP